MDNLNSDKLMSSKLKTKLFKLMTSKYRNNNQIMLIATEHLVDIAIERGCILEIILISDSADFNILKNKYSKIRNIYVSTMKEITNITKIKGHYKIFGISKITNQISPPELCNSDNVLALANVQDPGNVGTLIRSAAAFNFTTILLNKYSCDPFNFKVVVSTEGAIFNVSILKYTENFNNFLYILKQKNFYIYGTFVHLKNSLSLYNVKNAKLKNVLLLGNESKGLDKNIKEYVNSNIVINTTSFVESLNVGTAGSIIMSHLYKINLK